MLRRLVTLTCALAMLVTVAVAMGHHHALVTAGDLEASACAFCCGGMAPAPEPTVAPPCFQWQAAMEPAAPEAAPRKATLPLSHSGNAPPARA